MSEPAIPVTLIERLRALNAKERYWLLRQALGHDFAPAPSFLAALARAAGLPAPDAAQQAQAFMAMDYHLNWIHAALCAEEFPSTGRKRTPMPTNPCNGLTGADEVWAIQNNQQDVDLLLAYPREQDGIPLIQLILVEAKGVMPADTEQQKSKLRRLQHIVSFAKRGGSPFAIDVRLVLMSPDEQLPASYKRDMVLYPDLLPNAAQSHLRLRLSEHEGSPEDDLRRLWKVRPRRPPARAAAAAESAADAGRWPLWSLTRRGGRRPGGADG